MKAQKLEKIFLAEEEQEKKILAKKVAAERAVSLFVYAPIHAAIVEIY